MSGFPTLLYKELLRFWKVSVQTVAAPVLTALLYLVVFAYALGDRVRVFEQVSYAQFLVPGLVMMSVLQNAFANSSSSLIQSKITGNLVFVLLTPLSPLEMFLAYILAAIVRGLTVGLGVLLVTLALADVPIQHPLWALSFAVLGGGILGAMGIIAAIWADKFDQLAAFQNFVIVPLTFLAGVFYSVHSLPPFWQQASHLNPFFYMVDGFRYGFLGVGDVPPWISLAVVGACMLALGALCLRLLATGYSCALNLSRLKYDAFPACEANPWSCPKTSSAISRRLGASMRRSWATAITEADRQRSLPGQASCPRTLVYKALRCMRERSTPCPCRPTLRRLGSRPATRDDGPALIQAAAARGIRISGAKERCPSCAPPAYADIAGVQRSHCATSRTLPCWPGWAEVSLDEAGVA